MSGFELDDDVEDEAGDNTAAIEDAADLVVEPVVSTTLDAADGTPEDEDDIAVHAASAALARNTALSDDEDLAEDDALPATLRMSGSRKALTSAAVRFLLRFMVINIDGELSDVPGIVKQCGCRLQRPSSVGGCSW
jgi:hypothetical protein